MTARTNIDFAQLCKDLTRYQCFIQVDFHPQEIEVSAEYEPLGAQERHWTIVARNIPEAQKFLKSIKQEIKDVYKKEPI